MSLKENMALQIVNDMFTSRTALISFLRERLNLKLPKNTKIDEVVKRILEKGKEQEFCQVVFKDIGFDVRVSNFEEAYDIYKLGFLFTFFSVKELVQMAEELSKQQTKWKFRRRPRKSLIQSILKKCNS